LGRVHQHITRHRPDDNNAGTFVPALSPKQAQRRKKR
jgi:hypothetical protein